MSDTPHKRTNPGAQLRPSSSLDLSFPAEFLRPPVERMALAQDSTPAAGRRVVLDAHTGGSHEFLVGNAATGGVSQVHPDADTWRTRDRVRFEQMPGTALEARWISAPAGAAVWNNIPNGTWDRQGVGGQSRIIFTWTSAAGDTATTTVSRTFAGENDPDGAEKLTAGAQWAQLQHTVATVIRPPNVANDLAEAAKFSEWTTVDLELQDRGGARVLNVQVSEVPAQHTATDDNATETTYTGSGPHWETNRPQTKAPDGANYEEHRYGIHHSMDVAARQTARVGPIIGQWSAYTGAGAGVTDTDAVPKTTALMGFTRISAGLNTTWDTNETGCFILGTGRAPENLPSRISGATSVPVRIRVYARFSAAGAGTGVVRFQSTDRSWVDLTLDRAVVGTDWDWYTETGWLEASVATDDFWPNMQDFFRVDGEYQLEVRYWTVTYGDFPVGV